MNRGGHDFKITNQYVPVVDTSVDFVTIIVFTVFLGSTRINIFLSQFSRVVFPAFRDVTLLDFSILFPIVPLTQFHYQTGIHDLIFARTVVRKPDLRSSAANSSFIRPASCRASRNTQSSEYRSRI